MHRFTEFLSVSLHLETYTVALPLLQSSDQRDLTFNLFLAAQFTVFSTDKIHSTTMILWTSHLQTIWCVDASDVTASTVQISRHFAANIMVVFNCFELAPLLNLSSLQSMTNQVKWIKHCAVRQFKWS